VNDWPAMREQARRAHEIGIRCNDADLQALRLAFEGLARTHLGEVAEGTRLLDEAMASAVAGEVATMPTGIIYCRMLCACLDLQDFGRAHEWTKVIEGCPATAGPTERRSSSGRARPRKAPQEALRGVEETATLDLAHAGVACREDPDLLEMSQTSPGPVDLGTTARVVRRQGHGRVEGTATVVEYEPEDLAAWDLRFGAFRLHQRAELLPEQGGAETRLRLSIETSAQGPMRLLVPLLRGRFPQGDDPKPAHHRRAARARGTVTGC
jgi:hypothetical protein